VSHCTPSQELLPTIMAPHGWSGCGGVSMEANRSPCSATQSRTMSGGEEQVRALAAGPTSSQMIGVETVGTGEPVASRATVVLDLLFWLQLMKTLPVPGAFGQARQRAGGCSRSSRSANTRAQR